LKLLRFDTTIAVCALLLSAIAATAAVYQTHVIAEENSASVWPYISFEFDSAPKHITLSMLNNGLGPALIRSAQVYLDGKPIDSWSSAFARLSGNRHVYGAFSTISGEAVLRPGDKLQLFDARGPFDQQWLAANQKRIRFTVCYCSLLENCWLKTAGPVAPPPQPIAHCPAATLSGNGI